ncbi:hypothetical protein QF042_001078 [Pedobacter sp. W3I1]|uniref:MG2 domain-containing protein n=1 Tax=Pedobacter sp. W3I1 TaxID=3042291 RepID=UPI00278B25D0|nr:MG2 domain-containing protein [Pedobacter sp. W3I1]MDQ0637513.1 hypothetical protein [Pedobacter sp. W3I1]
MNLSLRFSALFLFIFWFSFDASAQYKYTQVDFYRIDSIANQGKPKDALAIIEKINQQAHQDHNTPLLIKSVIYRIMFQGYLEENAFDKILINLRDDITKAKQPEKSILQSLLAETYWNYLQQNRWQISQRTQVQGDIGNDIKTWNIKKLSDETVKYYLLSLKEVQLLQQTKVDILDAVLAGDKNNRTFRPTLYDLLAHRAIDVFSNSQINLTQHDDELFDMDYTAWYGDRQRFLAIALPSDSTSFKLQNLLLFRNLIKFHQNSNNFSALADVDLKRLKFVQQNFNGGDKEDLYYSALSQLAGQSSQTEVYADILYEQANMRKNGALLIDTNKQNLIKAIALAEKAVNAYPKSIGAQNARNVIEQIKSSELSIKTKGYVLPDKPIQLYLSYKNADTIQLRLFKSPDLQLDDQQFKSKADFLTFFTKNKIIKQWTVITPKTGDYQTHTLIDKIDGLPFGAYTLIAQTINRKQKDSVYSNINFKVTAMAVINRRINDNHEYFVSDLRNGMPLKNVKIQQRRYDYNTRKYIDGELLTTNLNGYASTAETQSGMSSALVKMGKDELRVNINGYYSYRNNDDEDKERVILFTDRPIYRPGQTVYYKGLCLKLVNGKNKIEVNKGVEVLFNDANGKEIAKNNVTSNDYGTFQGSFSIPMGKLNGNMEIKTDYGRINIQVEEYKRPTFEVVFDKPNQKYKLNDTIKVQGKASAFSGYSVNNAKINYKIFRRAIYDYRLNYEQRIAIYGSGVFERKQIAIGKTNTQLGGKFDITFFAKATNIKQNYSYDIEIEVTDLNGETRTKSTSINVGQKDINLNISAEQVIYVSNKTDSIPFWVTNLNNEPIKANIQAEWSLLQSPLRLMNKSPFYAEHYTMSKEEFIMDFPDEDYNNELEVAKWPVKSVELKQNLFIDHGRGNLTFNQKNLKPGYYKISLFAINEQQDTIKVDKNLVVYNDQPAVIQSNIEWIAPEVSVIKATESAVFRLAGLADNSKAYYEVYYRDSIAEKVWIDLSPKQSMIKIKPQANYEDGFAVQFTMIHQGTVYNSMQQVKITDPQKELNIKFLTFRDKLQPGEKESWKLQISNKNGEKQMAEMVATLYDASLDDLKRMDWATQLSTSFNYYYYNWNFNTNDITNQSYLWL